MLGCCLFLVFCVFSSISQITATDLDGNTVNGLEAVNVLKETRPQQTLSQDAITKIMKEYLDYTNNSETSSDKLELKFLSESIYNRFYLPNRELLGLIKNNYKNVNEDADIRQIFNEKIGKDFYQARSKRIRAYLEAKELKGEITYNQFNYWVEQDEKFDSYTYGYCEGWKGIMSTLTWPILIMMIVCIGVSPIFAGEYQSKCDSLILCMRFGKSKLVLSKVLIAWIHASVVYWGISILYSTVFLGVLGTSGGNLPIQIYYPSVPVSYQLTMSQACILALLLGYVLILSSMGITLYLSSVFKNTYGVIIVVFLMCEWYNKVKCLRKLEVN